MPTTKLREQTGPTGLTLFGPLPGTDNIYLMWSGPGGRLNMTVNPFDRGGTILSIEHPTADGTYNTRAEARAAVAAFVAANPRRTGDDARGSAMTTVYLSLNIPGGQYGDCQQAVPCLLCDKSHDLLWTVQRVPLETGLYWRAMRLNGKKVLIEGSLPNRVDRLPRDAKLVSREDAARLWHEDNESHTFGGPNVARALRESIARSNASGSRA